MSNPSYAYIGHWSFTQKPLGVTSCDFLQNGTLHCKETLNPELRAGYLHVVQSQNLLYALDETDHLQGSIGGGGCLYVYHISPEDGSLQLMQKCPTLAVNPSYLCITPDGKYMIVAHHTLRAHVTQIAAHPDGTYHAETKFDDAALVLFRLNPDGTVGAAIDAAVHHGDGLPGAHPMSHLHYVHADPSGKLYIVTDKGTDKVYTYHVDTVHEKLVFLNEFSVENGSAPRYCAFHPSLPLVYLNNERNPVLDVFHYDTASGKLKLLAVVPLLSAPADSSLTIEASDLLISPDGHMLYAAIRGVNQMAVLSLDAEGIPSLVQTLSYGGENCRGVQFAPDHSAVYSANMDSNTVTVMPIKADGTLQPAQLAANIDSPANLTFFTV